MKKIVLSTIMLFLGIIVTNAQADTNPTGWVYAGDSKDYDNEHVVNVGLVDANGNALSFGADEILWLGAFINDECRGIVEIAKETTNVGDVYYFPMRVQGSSNDNGKAISFKLYKSTSADPESNNIPSEFWYELNEFYGNSLTYVNGTEANFPSNLFKLQFVEPTGYTFPNELTVNVGETLDLLPLIKFEPKAANVPSNIFWDFDNSQQYIKVENNVLSGLKPSRSASLILGIGKLVDSDEQRWTDVYVRQAITSLTLKEEHTEEQVVYKSDTDSLTAIMSNCYEIEPADANEDLVWSWDVAEDFTKNDTVDVNGYPYTTWTPNTAGHHKLVLKGGEHSITLPVYVMNHVDKIAMKSGKGILQLFPGDNVSEMLPYMYEFTPSEYINDEVTYEIHYDPYNQLKYIDGQIIADKVRETTTGQIYIRPKDNPELYARVYVLTRPNVTEAKVKQDILGFEFKGDSIDISNNIIDNFEFSSDKSFKPREGEITTSDTAVVSLYFNQSDTTWTAIAKGVGSATITFNRSVIRSKIIDGDLKDYNRETVTAKFTVTVSEGLINFTCSPDTIIMGRSQVRTITLKPNPETATFDPEGITVEVIVNQYFTAWELAKAEPVAGDETGLQWTITPEAIGSGKIIIKYNGEEKGSNSGITIGQNFNQEIGWAWVTPYGGTIESIQALYGNALQEMRSQTSLLFNDPVYGYFGQLKTMEQMKAYKVYTKSAMSDGNYNKGTYYYDPDELTDFEFNPKWNWFGTPYQFDRAVNDIMTGIDFAEGDRIISKADGFTEFNGTEWEGSLTTLKAGEGYLLYTGIEAYSTLQYTAETVLGKPASQPSNAHALKKHANVWDYNAAQFSDNMSMIADLGEEFADDRYSIGAYINGECRGEGVCVNGKWFITIHGDAASNGQAINFRVYDTMNGKTYDVDTTQPYSQMAGSLKAPISLKVAGSSTGIESISADSLNPNAKYYTIDGIEVTNPTTGLYIVVDGNKAQKVYVK